MDLTPREKEIIDLLGQGFTDKAISQKLNISFNTVRTHRQNLRTKFSVATTVEMIKKASDMKLI